AVYISRAVFLTFVGDSRVAAVVHPHEAPPVMRIPLVLLAAGAVGGGALGLSATTGIIPKFLAPVVGAAREAVAGPSEAVLAIISVAVALAGIGLAFYV